MATDDQQTALIQAERDKLAKAWARMVNCISHELSSRTALFGLIAKDLDAVVPNFIAYIEEAMVNGNKPANFTEKDINKAKKLLANLNNTIESLRAFYKVLYPFNQELLQPIDEFPARTIKSYLEEALVNHPYEKEGEKESIQVNCVVNFNCKINPFFMGPLLFHLITQCLLRIPYDKNGEVFIETAENDNFNLLYARVLVEKIDASFVESAFDLFFERHNKEIKLGLGYCRLALLQNGGDIICAVNENKQLMFTVMFPR